MKYGVKITFSDGSSGYCDAERFIGTPPLRSEQYQFPTFASAKRALRWATGYYLFSGAVKFEVEEAPPPAEMPFGDLPVGNMFEVKGYSRSRKYIKMYPCGWEIEHPVVADQVHPAVYVSDGVPNLVAFEPSRIVVDLGPANLDDV